MQAVFWSTTSLLRSCDMYLEIILFLTFLLTSFSVIGNDVIQTLGTYISSNKGISWVIQFAYIGSILVVTVLLGWHFNHGDPTYGRGAELNIDQNLMDWWVLLPPLVLIVLTRFGIPISTTFLILSTFSPQLLISKMILKSLLGYGIAFVFSLAFYIFLSKKLKAIPNKNGKIWMVLQWITTGTLWCTWLMQDLVNMFIYYPSPMTLERICFLLVIILVIVAFILRGKGGRIQEVIDQKSATHNLASATVIDMTYALILILFTFVNNVPMSTTWVFIGLLAGRELGMTLALKSNKIQSARKLIVKDLLKVSIGMAVSLLITAIMYYFFTVKVEGNN